MDRPSPTSLLSEEEGARLLRHARQTLAARLAQRPAPSLDESERQAHPLFEAQRGAFVTWKRKPSGELRGCIGYMEGRGPLWKDVGSLAVSAATRDRRFAPVKPGELEGLTASISVLTPMEPIAPADVEVGRHGLLLELGQDRGVFLPQVPVEFGWDRETYLDRLCRKAGVPKDSWKNPKARLSGFEAQVFRESP
ncbi:MAG: AmmeMemoRadiSam system protein A [Planctomycetota bacterium]|jgi:AmmeMemoRadiSam system protein A